jgi:putative thioredoxin
MSTPFSRPGAVDLSGLKTDPAQRGAQQSGGSSYTLLVDEQNFQDLLESSMQAPVVLVVYSPSRVPSSVALADNLETIATELDGRLLLGRIDVDAQPAIAQAMQATMVPLVALVVQGRLQPLFQDVPPMEELRALLGELLQQLTVQGVSGRHQPLSVATSSEGEETGDPRYAPAEDALVAGDVDAAVAEYQKLLDANPVDSEAAVGLARAKLMRRTSGVDLDDARAAAAARPDDVDAQVMVADLDLLGGHLDDAFDRLVDLVRRTSGDDRDRTRLHLIELFTVVGDDPRVLKARQSLASALF